MEQVAKHLIISGRVQGVFYRASCAQQANRIGVYGWVRNLPDDSVEAWVQGQPEKVEALIAWCRTGPPSARVDKVRVSDEALDGGLAGFVTRY